jgi:iron complex outermembrane receptor protein
MKIRLSSSVYLTASLLAGSAFAMPVFAAEAQGEASHAGDSLQEIVVTAQRRSENVMEVPLSIAAETSEQLASSGIKDITDLQFTTPGFNVSDSSGYTQVYIRGIGNSIFVGADPSVATFINDVPRIYGSMVNNFIDVERVEVLKGAQGGLYGRNATGGVINIITRQPDTSAYKADVRVSYGEKQTFEAAAYFNAPIGDKIAFSLTGERIKHNAYDDNIASATPYSAANFPGGSFIGTAAQSAAFFNSANDPRGIADANFYAVDGKLLVKPTDNFKITLAADASNKDDSSGNGLYQIAPAVPQGTLGGLLAGFAGAKPNLPAGFIIGNTPKFTVAVAYPGFVRLKDSGESATAVLTLPAVELTSITAYRYQHTQFITDLAAGSVPLFSALVDNLKHYFYQELRAVSTADGPLHLIGGATYLLSQYNGKTELAYLTPLVIPGVTPVQTVHAFDQVRNYSIYAQGEYELTPQLSLIASGRFVHEANNAHFVFPTDASAGLTEQKFLPSATVSYKLPDGGNAYVRWAKGFKSGGINPVAPLGAFTNLDTQGGRFKGETVDTFETGVHVPLLDNKIQATSSVFYNNYKNLQTIAHANEAHRAIIEAIINAGSARTYGVEGTVDWRVARPLTLGVTAGYLNAKYKTFGNTDPTVLFPFNYDGTRLTNAPETQYSFNANFDQPIAPNLRLVASTLVTHTSSFLWEQSGAPGVLPDAEQAGYWLVNARIGVRTQDDKYGIAAYANNLFNNAYTTYGSSAAATGTLLNWGNRRIIGVELTARY